MPAPHPPTHPPSAACCAASSLRCAPGRLDFFSYSFLDGTIKKAFFPTSETLYWVRPRASCTAASPWQRLAPAAPRQHVLQPKQPWVVHSAWLGAGAVQRGRLHRTPAVVRQAPNAAACHLAAQVCFGLAMAARPAGALIFGHIGDTAGRTRALMLGIILMAGGWVGG